MSTRFYGIMPQLYFVDIIEDLKIVGGFIWSWLLKEIVLCPGRPPLIT